MPEGKKKGKRKRASNANIAKKKGPSRISIVLVEPKVAGNIGAVARAMLNFDLDDLVLVRPCERGQESFKRAMHADKVLDMAKVFSGLDEALKGCDYIVGTSDETTQLDRKHLRKAVTPRELVEHLKKVPGKVAIMFGREDFGLFNSELEKCDMFVSIPNSEKYPTMNLSHAVAVILYELFLSKAEVWRPTSSSDFERSKLKEMFEAYMDAIEFPSHKRRNARTMFKRIVGRADISKWEFYTLMGVFSRAIKKIERIQRRKGGPGKEARVRVKGL
jgi:TrmH family RNA methyltransferase